MFKKTYIPNCHPEPTKRGEGIFQASRGVAWKSDCRTLLARSLSVLRRIGMTNALTRRLPAHQRSHYALDAQLPRWNQIWKLRILGFQIRPPSFGDIPFQRRLAIDQCRDDVAVFGRLPVFQDYDITIHNVSADHGIASHPQSKSTAAARGVERIKIERHVALDVLFRQGCHARPGFRRKLEYRRPGCAARR